VKKLVASLSAVAVAIVLVVFAAPVANATPPWNCPTSGAGLSRSSICYQGSGQYRVAIFCAGPWNLWGEQVYGPWISTGYSRPSVAWCNPVEHVGSAFAQTR
jgi:hypothetical protein